MEAGIAPVAPAKPDGYPAAFVAGSVVALKFFIEGIPVPQGRPRFRIVTPKGRKPFGQVYPEPKTREWEEHIADYAMRQIIAIPAPGDGSTDFILPLEGRMLVVMRFNLPKPASYPASLVQHTKKPDLDNLVKSVLDGLVKGQILEDDKYITDLTISKRYTEPGHPVGVEVEITNIG